jgi:hypothetical protein
MQRYEDVFYTALLAQRKTEFHNLRIIEVLEKIVHLSQDTDTKLSQLSIRIARSPCSIF